MEWTAMIDNNDDSSSITSSSSSSSSSSDEDSDLSTSSEDHIHSSSTIAAIAAMYVYTGEGGGEVPEDVVRVRVDPSVTSIPASAFFSRQKLEEVELCEGLLEVGPRAFSRCASLKAIKVPSSVRAIRQYAFASCTSLAEVELGENLRTIERHAFFNCGFLRTVNIPDAVRDIGTLAFMSAGPVSLAIPDGVESIGDKAFSCCAFPRFRAPSLLTTIPTGMFCQCKSMFSLEMPEAPRIVERCAFWGCRSLRNVALSRDTVVEYTAFRNCADLQDLFESEAKVIDALGGRFDGLPVHGMMYYMSHNPVSVEGFLEAATTTIDRSEGGRHRQHDGMATSGGGVEKPDPSSGGARDCLGMTPLHILACSSVQDLDMHRAVVGRYPGDLVSEDRWGATPLLYAIWGGAPDDVVTFLLENIQRIHPRHAFDWSKMVETLGRASAPLNAMENLLRVHKHLVVPSPGGGRGQIIEWDKVMDEVARDNEYTASVMAFRFLMRRGYSGRVGAIGIREWREEVTRDIDNTLFGRRARLAEIRANLARYEREYRVLKEATSFLELALWKARISECEGGAAAFADGHATRDGPRLLREECRIVSGADTVIEHVLPYLLPRKGGDKSMQIPFFLDDSRR